jgi:uncharacterized protein YggE
MAEVETHGTGQVERIADRAVLQVFYTEQAKDRASAVSMLTRRIGTVEPIWERDGVQVRDRRFFVRDTWDVKRRSGAQANQSYLVRISDVAMLNDVVADLVLTEPTNLRGPSWELADREEAVRQAQREAVVDARRRAEGYAEALERRLGPLLRIMDGVVNPQPARFAASAVRMPAEAAVRPNIAELSLEPQLVTVVTTCTMTWEIVD